MNTTGLLLKRGKGYHWRISISGKQLWKSLQTGDHETAVLRSHYLSARVAATRIECSGATGSVLLERVKRTMDQALKSIVAQWVERELDKTEQARAVSPPPPNEDDDAYTETDIWSDLWEEYTEQLEENRLYAVADLAATLLQRFKLEPAQLAPFKRELLKARNKELIHIGHFLKWAKAHDLMTVVATDGLRIFGKAQVEDSTKKRPFSLQQMTTLRLELENVRQRVKDGR